MGSYIVRDEVERQEDNNHPIPRPHISHQRRVNPSMVCLSNRNLRANKHEHLQRQLYLHCQDSHTCHSFAQPRGSTIFAHSLYEGMPQVAAQLFSAMSCPPHHTMRSQRGSLRAAHLYLLSVKQIACSILNACCCPSGQRTTEGQRSLGD